MSFLNNLMLAAAAQSDVEGMGSLVSMASIVGAVRAFGASLVYSLFGLIMFVVAYKVLGLILPFSIHKELEEDQNTAVGIVLGCMILGLAIIIAAAVHG